MSRARLLKTYGESERDSEPSARPLESTVPPTRRANAAANVAMPVDGDARAFRSGRRMQRGTLRPMQKVSESSAEMQVWTLVLRNLREESVAPVPGWRCEPVSGAPTSYLA